MKKLSLIAVCLAFGALHMPFISFSQAKWQKNPFDQKVFIENKGQFDGRNNIEGERIQYAFVNHGVGIYFTSKGLSYCYDECKKINKEEWAKKEKGLRGKLKEAEAMKDPIRHVVRMDWIGANPDAQIISSEGVAHYFTYVDAKDLSGKSTLKAKAYNKITYKSIYPNIDVEYVFPSDSNGIKYSLILHPGANPTVIKMQYQNASDVSLDASGNAIIKSPFGNIIDHAPKTFYEDGEPISSEFHLNGNTVSFVLNLQPQISPEGVLRTNLKSIVIDPWTTVPTFLAFNSAYDIDYDLQGNVYVYGGAEPFQEIKFNSAGVIQWVFTHSIISPFWFGQFYGSFAVDPLSGSSYMVQGVGSPNKVAKLNSSGAVAAFFMGGTPNLEEMWRIIYNNCTKQAVIAGGNPSTPYQAGLIDTNLTALTPVNVLSTTSLNEDFALLALDNSNNCYMATAKSVGGGSFDNIMLKCPANTLLPVSFMVSDGYTFLELLSVPYVNNQIQGTNGFNGMAVNSNFLYTYDGSVLKKWNKTTGAFISSVSVAGTKFNWGGLDVDECDNIFVGGPSWVKQYDANLVLINTIPVMSDAYDVKLGPMNKLYVCGKGFVSELQITSAICNQSQINLTSSATSSSCTSSTGSASVTATGGAPPYTYLWNSTGQTTQTATGLSPGSYIVTVIDNSCIPKMQTDTVVVTSIGGFTASSTQSNISCNGGNNGSSTATVIGGVSPYTYNWSPSGGTNATATGLTSGSYTATITDASGCVQQLSVTITQPTLLTSTTTATNATCGNTNGSTTVTASGGASGYTYSWNPSGQTTATAAGFSAGNYSVTITDGNGCTTVNTVSVTSTGSIIATVGPNSTICSGQTVTLNSLGGINYLWSSGQTTSTISVSPTVTTTYSVIVSSGNCADTAFAVVTVNPSPSITVSGNTTLCIGDISTLSASGSTNYSWSNGNTNSVINVSPSATTIYTVTTSNGICTSTTSVTVTVSLPPVANAIGAVICLGQTATLSATGGGTYLWSNGSTSNPILVSPTSSSTYSVIVSIGSCSDTTSTMVTVNPSPTASAWSNAIITQGQSTTLSASGGGNYLWSNGSTANPINVSPPITTFYCVTVSNGICTDSACVKVTVEPINCTPVSNEDAFVLPSAFSPNGDGQNDKWRLLYVPLLADCIAEFQVFVYNRWGEKIFEGTDINFIWDGTYKGKLEDTAVFGYYLEGTFKDGTGVKKKGNISLIR